ncbi:MAG: glycosyltransferase family 4 protein [Chloroflexi bacterium]|nr:glycosyltransferase family 4 protein [Chloroflexota bacterium]MCC6894971.1 glycosyltransferase family 4 protein [Anaerolineae bacterium]
MHIAFNGWFWNQPNTGSGQYLRYLLHNLCRVAPNLELTLVAPPHNPTPDDLPANVNVITTRGGSGNLGKVLFEQRSYPAAVKQSGADIAHVPYWGPPLSSPAKLVTSILDVIPVALPEYSSGFRARLYTSLVTAASRGNAHTITISNAAKADIVKYLGLPEDSITTTYLAVNENYHPRMGAERDAAVRAKYDLPDQFVLYMGGFDIRKQVNQLLLAYTYVGQAEGDNIPLVIAGREPEWGSPMFPDLRKYAAELNITDYIRWIGYIDEADKPSLYRLADVFVYPSIYEGFGLPVLEAMASGTPVVANNVSSIPEVASDAAFLVDEGNAKAMGGAIIALLLQQPFRDSLINQGLARATHFSWRKTAKETLAVYEKVMVM